MTQSYSTAPQPNFTAFWAHIKSDSSLSYSQTSLPKARPLLCFYLPRTCKVSSAEQCNGCQPVAMPEFSLCSASIIVPTPWCFPESAATTPIFDHLATYDYQRCVNQVYVQSASIRCNGAKISLLLKNRICNDFKMIWNRKYNHLHTKKCTACTYNGLRMRYHRHKY